MFRRRYLMPLKELFTSCTCRWGGRVVRAAGVPGDGSGPGCTHLRAPVDKEHSGVLLPRLQGVRLVDHAVQLHVGTRVEVEDLGRHVVRGAVCGDRGG